ncbi:hypothetical protein OIV83_000072 [Microbotryomycetes sp. JL201]|nr:hypothetical protein OIV83_000072 [Microbotryomycetes sp. JL201]
MLDMLVIGTLLIYLQKGNLRAGPHNRETPSKLQFREYAGTLAPNRAIAKYMFLATCFSSCAGFLLAAKYVGATSTRSALGLATSPSATLATNVLVLCRFNCLVVELMASLRAHLPPSLPLPNAAPLQPETSILLHQEGLRTTFDYFRAATPSDAIVVTHDDAHQGDSRLDTAASTYSPLSSPQPHSYHTPPTKPERSLLRSPPSSSSLHSSAFWTEQSPPTSRARTPSMLDVLQASPSSQQSLASTTKRLSALSVLQTLVTSPKSRAVSVAANSPKEPMTTDDPFARNPNREAVETWRKRSASAMSVAASPEIHGASREPTIFEADTLSLSHEPDLTGSSKEGHDSAGVFAEGLGLTWSPEADVDSSAEMMTARAVSLAMQDSTVDSFQTASSSAPFSTSPTPPIAASPSASTITRQLKRSPSSLWMRRPDEGSGERRLSSPRQRLIASLRGFGKGREVLDVLEHASHSDLSFACVGDSPRPSFAQTQAGVPRRSMSAGAIAAIPDLDAFPPAPFMRQPKPESPTTPSTLRGSLRQTLSSKKSWWKLGSSMRPNSRVGTPYRPRSMSAPALYSGSSEGSVGSSYDFVSATSLGVTDAPSRTSEEIFRLPTPRRLSPLPADLFQRDSLERVSESSCAPTESSMAEASPFRRRQKGSLTSLEQLTVVADAMHRFSEDDSLPAEMNKETSAAAVERRLHQSRSLSALVTSPRSLFIEGFGSPRSSSAHMVPLSPRLYARNMGWTDTTCSTIESLHLDMPIKGAQHAQSPTLSASEASSSPALMFSPMSALFNSPSSLHPPMTPPTPMSSFLEFGMLPEQREKEDDSSALSATVKG